MHSCIRNSVSIAKRMDKELTGNRRRFIYIYLVIYGTLCVRATFTPRFLSERLTARPSQPLQSPPSDKQTSQRIDCKEAALRLLTPTFLLHLLWMLVLSLVSVVAVMDLLLKLVFISCSLGVKYATIGQASNLGAVYTESRISPRIYTGSP